MITILQFIGAFLLVLVLPGLALDWALFREAGTRPAGERLMVWVGASLAVVILLGLVLDLTPWGLGSTPIAVSLTAFTMLAALAGLVRRARLDTTGRLARSTWSIPRPRSLPTLVVVLSLLVLGAAAGVSARSIEKNGTIEFTELSVSPVNATGNVRLKITSHLLQAQTFELSTYLNGKQLESIATVRLLPGDSRTTTVSVDGAASSSALFEARLLRDGKRYRSVSLWIPAEAAP